MTNYKCFGILALISISFLGCTENKVETPAPTTPVVATTSPAELAAADEAKQELQDQKKCNETWADAASAYEKLSQKANSENFKLLSNAIPQRGETLLRCENQDVILKALDREMQMLEKASGGVFNFTVFLARVQHIGDGAVAEGICEQGPLLLKKDVISFVKALHQERKALVYIDCLSASAYDLVDASPEKIRKSYESRIALLKMVKNKELLETRDRLIEAVTNRLKSY